MNRESRDLLPSTPVERIRFRRLVAPIVVLWLLSVLVRLQSYDPRQNVENLDATYHVLLTVQALRESPPSVHHFLPIVNLASSRQRNLNFGSTVADAAGNRFYTSFGAIGFLVPYAVLGAFHADPTPQNLMAVNFAIHVIATLLLALLVDEALAESGVERRTRSLAVLLSAATYLFVNESLFSHGLIYWHHSLFQPVWMLQLLLFFRIVRRWDAVERPSRAQFAALIAVSVLGPMVEWSGYIANAAIAGWLWWRARAACAASPRRGPRRLALAVLAAAALAGLVFVAHFALAIGIRPLVAALTERAQARDAAAGSITALLRGYYQSFLLLPMLAIAAPFVVRAQSRRWPAVSPALAGLLVVTAIPLIENVLLMQHATTYTFDRLKAEIVMCLVLAIATTQLRDAAQRVFAALWIAIVAANLLYHPNRTRDMSLALAHDRAVLEALQPVAKPCALYAVTGYARGWVYLTLHDNVAENIANPDMLRRLAQVRGSCQAILLAGSNIGNQIYDWIGAVVYDPPDSMRVFELQRRR